jgi:hypothetical protein
MAKVGRPRKLKLVSLDTAIKIIRQYFIDKGVSPDDLDKFVPAKGTIYNKISRKTLTNHGKRIVLLDETEILEKLCS